MTIAIKYCGGCNPRYNRAALATRLAGDFLGAKLVGPDAEAPDFAVVLCGCPNRCASHAGLHGRMGKWVLDGPEAYQALKDAIAKETDAWTGRQPTSSD